MIITIDGPVASGKTTIGLLLSIELSKIYKKDFYFLDTGLIYRKYTFLLLNEKNLKLKNNIDNLKKFPKFNIDNFKDLIFKNIDLKTFEEKINYLFTEEIATITSKLATKKNIRDYLTKIQLELVNSKDAVVVGRDSGSIVFKNAEFKFFLYASNYIRALRRYYQYKKNNLDNKLSFHDILIKIIKRDEQDKLRKYAPLPDINNLPNDFILINTDNLTIEQTINKIISFITKKGTKYILKNN
ncbi:MAG: (d)CMP kinase [bacterium]